MASTYLVSGKQQFDRFGGVDLAAAFGGFLDFHCKGTEFFYFLCEVAERSERRIKGGHLFLGMSGCSELLKELLVGILRGFLKEDRLTLFRWYLKVTVDLKFLLCSIKPFFETCCIENRGNEG